MSAPELTSSRNPTVQWVRALARAKARREAGVAVAEGVKAVSELLPLAGHVSHLFWCAGDGARPEVAELAAEFTARGVAVTQVAGNVMAAMADTRTPQGVLAVARVAPAPLKDILGRAGDVLVLDRVQDPGNVGTLLRTVEAVGGAGVVLLPGCADPTGPKAVRAAAASLFRVPYVAWHDSAAELADALTGAGLPLAVATAEGNPPDAALLGLPRVAWALGSEGHGVSQELAAHADRNVAIPMAGDIDSLNVAVAGSVLLYARALAGSPGGKSG